MLLLNLQTLLLGVWTPATKKCRLKLPSTVRLTPFLATILRVQTATLLLFFPFGWDGSCEDRYLLSYTYIFSVNIVPSNLRLWIPLISHQHVI